MNSLYYEAKLNGATGNFAAHYLAYPEIDWINFSSKFIESLNDGAMIKIKPNMHTTQIEPHDSFVRICDGVRRINTIFLDMNQDIWRYISDGWLAQKQGKVKGFSYLGSSSTMPQKINPTDFENSEANLGLANSLFEFFSRKLPISRLQRDISDSSVFRNSILPFAYSLNAYKAIIKGLGKIEPDVSEIKKALEENPEVVAEGIQTVLRAHGEENAYNLVKDFFRGKRRTMPEIKEFIKGLNTTENVKKKLANLSPENYYGLADKLVSG